MIQIDTWDTEKPMEESSATAEACLLENTLMTPTPTPPPGPLNGSKGNKSNCPQSVLTLGFRSDRQYFKRNDAHIVAEGVYVRPPPPPFSWGPFDFSESFFLLLLDCNTFLTNDGNATFEDVFDADRACLRAGLEKWWFWKIIIILMKRQKNQIIKYEYML